jgi:citrate lyase subunit beta / citryl-CoA lyase
MNVWLFVPGHDQRKLPKALSSDADAVIIDWEDAVPPGQKEAARAQTRATLASSNSTRRVIVRINHPRTPYGMDDIGALTGLPLGGVMLPKVEAAADLQIESLVKLNLPLIALIETALGVERVYEIARAHPLVERLAFGALDFVADIGGQWTAEGEAFQYAQSRVIIAARAAGLAETMGGVYPQIHDLEGLKRDTLKGRILGFRGKTVIHPSHISLVREMLKPTPEEVAEAQQIIQAFAEAVADNRAALTINGRFIDPPVVRWAEQILQAAGQSGS